jgi:hypothetical protein
MNYNPYISYYENQAGGSGISSVYSGSSYQKGHGIGSFLGSLFKGIIPLLSKASKAVGSEFLKTSGNIAKDIALKQPWKVSVKSRLKEAGSHLNERFGNHIDSMIGSGYINAKQRKLRHSSLRSGRVKKCKKKKCRKINKNKIKNTDIFS